MPGSEPKAHHYVQRAYLEAFCDPKFPGKSSIWVYTPNKEIRHQTPSQCAKENYFYCFDKDGARSFEVEQHLAWLEDQSLPVLKEAQLGRLPRTIKDRFTLAGYTALSAMRTPAARAIFDQAIIDDQVERLRDLVNTPGKLEEAVKKREIKTGEKLDPAEERRKLKGGQMRATQTSRNWSLRMMFEQLEFQQKRIVRMSWTLLRARGAYFLTSDSPVLLMRPVEETDVVPDGAFSPDFFFPISREMALAGGNSMPGSHGDLDASQVRLFNLKLINRASRSVFSPFQAPYVQQKLNQCFEHRESTKKSDVIQL